MAVMTTRLKAALGDEALNELFLLLDEKSLDGRREILTRLEIVEHDLGEVKTELRDFRRDVNERFDRMSAQFNDRFDRMAEHMGSMIKWTVGTLALFGTLMTALLALGQFAK